jgi:hypothetical protein
MTFAGLLIYFLIMKATGLLEIIELRFLNFFILAAGVMLAVKHYRHATEGPIDYLEGFGVGFFTSCIAGLTFAFFLYIYLGVFDPGFMEYLKHTPMGQHLSPMSSAFGILIEATASGTVLTLLSLQYFRKPRSTRHPIRGRGVHHPV